MAGAMLVALAALAGCGRHATVAGGTAKAASASLAATPAAPPPTARAMADRMLAGGPFAPDQGGFTVLQPLSCQTALPTPPVDWQVRCRAYYRDAQRGGQPAIVEIQLFDHDVAFAPLDQPVKDHIAGWGGTWALASTPDLRFTVKSTGATTKLDAACHQALGRRNSPAYCSILASPRAFVIVGVKPARTSTASLTISDAPGQNNSGRDADHAQDLATQVALMVESAAGR